ncbi:MAG: hypothetical protein PHU81_09100 [Acidobacteriota bacterium]|nr:hypothetical protein [Acidobacteriota bacterium]
MVYFFLKRRILAVLSIIFLLQAVSCEKKQAVPGLEVSVSFSDKDLSDNLLTSLKIKFITTSDFQPLTEDYMLMAQALSGEKLLWQAEIPLALTVARWQPNQVYETEKLIYFPPFIDRFSRPADQGLPVDLSLYFKSPRGRGMILVYQSRLRLRPYPANIPDVVFLDGWVKIKWPGKGRGDFQIERWTGRQASCWLRNPGRPATLMLRGSATSGNAPGLTVVIALGGRVLEEFELQPGSFEKIYQLSASDLGGNDGIELTISVNRTVRISDIYPEMKDERLIGLRIDTVYFR